MKRSLAILCIFLLTFTAAISAAPLDSQKGSGGKKSQQSLTKLKKQSLDKKYDSNDQVRVLVELKEDPAISYAQKQKKRFKDLPNSKKKELKAEKLTSHKKVKDKAKQKNITFKELENFTTVVNGFSAKIAFGDIKSFEAIPEVAAVHVVNEYERPEEKPEMIYSKELVQAQEAWRDYGYKGEGMIVGIIDTGIDPTHRDMVLGGDTNDELTQGMVADLKTANNLRGKFYTEKVPYGYNYMDDNEEIRDLGPGASMHGMHVAGTVGANGDEANKSKGIKGVAPEAQLLALKVFGNDPNMPSTWGDIYVKAIDEAITLGADVLNMSLGSTAGFVSANDPEQQAVSRAVDNGIVMSISAGNSAHFGNGAANPFATNPDIGVSGAPGLSYDSVQVASLENSFLDLEALDYNIDGTAGKAPFMSASSVHPKDLDKKPYEIAYAGLGMPEELTNANVKGKFALIKRGTLTFVDKTKNAQAAGAIGVIIYNNADGIFSMATEPSITIPQLSMLKSDGDRLQQAVSAGKPVTVSFNDGEKAKVANPEAGKMSAFSSWGLTPNLDFKPEITAPGGQIYSTLNDDQYGMMSGTSMAAPHVSGGSALVLQRVDKDFGLTGFNRVNLAKNIMMNTSKPLIDKGTANNANKWDLPYSPRRQGSGVVQLHSALKTPVVVTEAFKNEAKVALKEVGNTFAFSLKAQNFSDQAVDYDVKGNIQTDFATKGRLGYSANILEAQKILDASIKVKGSDSTIITVPAKGSVTFEVTVDLSNAKVLADDLKTPAAVDTVFPNGYFVEGYITLKDPSDTNPELHVPYVGFKGKWDKAPILDGTIYDNSSFYGAAGALSTEGEDFAYLGVDPVTGTQTNKDWIAFSPNGDGTQDDFIPLPSFLRNAKKVEYSVVDSSWKELRKLRTENNVTKNYFDGGKSAKYSLQPARKWDGKLNNALAKDGQYFYQIKAMVDYEGAEWQTFKIPVKLDTTVPSVKFAKKGKVLALTGSDNANGSGLAYYDVQIDGKSVIESPLAPTTKEYTLPDTTGQKVQVIAVDFAGNKKSAEYDLNADTPEEDKTVPSVYLESPEALSVSSANNITINGYIEEPSGLREFTIDGKTVTAAYNAEKKRYEFSLTKNFADGVQTFIVKATDTAGNSISFKRTFMVDGKGPTLTVTGLPKKNTVPAKGANPLVDVTLADNFDDIRFYLNGNEVFYNEFKEPFAMRGFKKTIKDLELPLLPGKNTFLFEVTDLGGHKTTKEVTITKERKSRK
ncbi:S8 family serine peptidase [Peribacillus cavernae]|nr:S8 family serine peptidase [Peribacillus cavernae]